MGDRPDTAANRAISLPSPPPLADASEAVDLESLENAPPFWRETRSRKRLLKQLSMYEAPRYRAWEKRRRQILDREQRRRNSVGGSLDGNLTDEDLKELKGCIELGFGFKEESGTTLCPTLPALDLYFAVHRQFWTSPVNSPCSNGSSGSSSFGGANSPSGSPLSDSESSWKICSPGDDPHQVKTRLKHWAQAVACSVLQSPPSRGGEMDNNTSDKDG